MHDEITTNSRDQFSNPIGRQYDLGREGAFSQFKVLVGLLCPFHLNEYQFNQHAGKALQEKGFQVECKFLHTIQILVYHCQIGIQRE